jgi:hypothetical protein
MAELRHRPRISREEVLDDALEVGVVADVLGSAAAGDDERGVVGRLDVGEGEVGLPGVSRLLGVGVEAVLEVMESPVRIRTLGIWDLLPSVRSGGDGTI